MILKRSRLKRLILQMIQAHSPRVMAGEGLEVRRVGRIDVVGLDAQNTAKLAAITDLTLPATSSGSLNMGPATSDSGSVAGIGGGPPRLPTLGPGRRLR